MASPRDSVSKPIEIVLADDHAMVRSGLRRVLESERDLRVVAEAGDVPTTIEETRRHRPDLVMLDLNMRGVLTLPAIGQVLEASPNTAVVILTMESDPVFARRALSEGARGYVLKEAAEAELVESVRSVASGRTYLDPALGARLASAPAAPAGTVAGLAQGDPELAVGTTFAGHRIDAFLGRGGMGLVFRATDWALDRSVALKVIAPEVARDAAFRSRFERECRLAAAIEHRHAVEVFHAGEEAGLLYLTMRYIDGTDLDRLLEKEERLAPPRTVSILTQIGGALDEAHRIGLVHRDVKPGNILLTSRADGEQAFLTDFGVTKRVAETSKTRTAVGLGTVDYIAPEQIQGGVVDARTDVYSLGCVLFECLTGEVPFYRETDIKTLWAHVNEAPPDPLVVNPALPPGFKRVLGRALAKRPDDRQPSTGDLARAAAAALAAA